MTPIGEITERLRQLLSNEDQLIRDVFEASDQDIEIIQVDQLEEGLDSKGRKITPKYRSDKYARRKQAMNSKPGFGTPDLRLTGKYHRAMKVQLAVDSFRILNTDSKDKDLTDKYGPVKGLNEESKEGLKVILKPRMQRLLRKALLR